jgi:hypothetical protein
MCVRLEVLLCQIAFQTTLGYLAYLQAGVAEPSVVWEV